MRTINLIINNNKRHNYRASENMQIKKFCTRQCAPRDLHFRSPAVEARQTGNESTNLCQSHSQPATTCTIVTLVTLHYHHEIMHVGKWTLFLDHSHQNRDRTKKSTHHRPSSYVKDSIAKPSRLITSVDLRTLLTHIEVPDLAHACQVEIFSVWRCCTRRFRNS